MTKLRPPSTIPGCCCMVNLISVRKKILNKRLIFDILDIDEETVFDKIIEGLNDPYLQNDKYWIQHEPGSNYFALRLEDGR